MNATKTNGEMAAYLSDGAVVIDVRSKEEFSFGHVKGSENIPLQQIPAAIDKLKTRKARYVLCCASGNRSGQAERFLSGHGIDCINGGSWQNVASAC